MKISIPYGAEWLTAHWDGPADIQTLDIPDAPALPDLDQALSEALTRPVGLTQPLKDTLVPGGTVLIVVSDSFRKTGVDQLLPQLLEYLHSCGIDASRISFLFATGTHRAPDEAEKEVILGSEVYRRYRDRAFAHDPHDKDNLVFRGETQRGTPVYVNRRAIDADCVLLTGSVVLHYFGGFGGGRKSVVPGIAGVESIAANHALNLHPTEDRLNPDVRIGCSIGNPVAEDMLEAAKLCGRFFLVNTVLNRQGEIAGLFCGEMEEAHEAACGFARALYTVPIATQADLTIASAGTAKNFIQSHKALYNAFQATKPGGSIILAAPAPEGYGGNRFSEWLSLGSREAIITELRKNAEINGQTALSTLEKARNTIFVSEMGADEIRALGGRKANTLDEAITLARNTLEMQEIKSPCCFIMPSAAFSVPERSAASSVYPARENRVHH